MIRVWRHFWNIAILGEKQILSAKIKTPSGAPLRAGQTFLEPDTQVSVFLKTKTPERIILFFSQRISCFTLRDPTSDHKCNILERYFFYQKKYGPEFIQIYLHFYLYTRINTKKEKNSKKNQKKKSLKKTLKFSGFQKEKIDIRQRTIKPRKNYLSGQTFSNENKYMKIHNWTIRPSHRPPR